MLKKIVTLALALALVGPLAGTALAGDGGKNPERRAERRRKVLERFDKDGDGKLSKEEKRAAKQAFREHHANKKHKHKRKGCDKPAEKAPGTT